MRGRWCHRYFGRTLQQWRWVLCVIATELLLKMIHRGLVGRRKVWKWLRLQSQRMRRRWLVRLPRDSRFFSLQLRILWRSRPAAVTLSSVKATLIHVLDWEKIVFRLRNNGGYGFESGSSIHKATTVALVVFLLLLLLLLGDGVSMGETSALRSPQLCDDRLHRHQILFLSTESKSIRFHRCFLKKITIFLPSCVYLFHSRSEHHWVEVLKQDIRDLVDIFHALLADIFFRLLFIGSLRRRRLRHRRSHDSLDALGRFGRFQLQSIKTEWMNEWINACKNDYCLLTDTCIYYW